MRRRLGLLLLGLFALSFAVPVPANTSGVARLEFDVYLNDKKVGKHSFEVVEANGVRQVMSEANFVYRILFIPAYKYEHRSAERWADNCLLEFDARTNANGDRIEVSGERTNSGFRVEKGEEPVELPECVMTFAYWNPDFLEQPRLLNPQTGEYVDVTVEKVGNEMLEVNGQPVDATRFRLTAYEVDLTLWYSRDDEWLALESVAEGDNIIRYERS
jgi:hypothetical protein